MSVPTLTNMAIAPAAPPPIALLAAFFRTSDRGFFCSSAACGMRRQRLKRYAVRDFPTTANGGMRTEWATKAVYTPVMGEFWLWSSPELRPKTMGSPLAHFATLCGDDGAFVRPRCRELVTCM